MQSQAAPGDQIPVYSPTNGDATRLPVSALAAYLQGEAAAAEATAVNRFTPVTGFNIAMPTPIAQTQWVLLQPAAALASGTVTLPPSTSTPDNTEVLVTTTQSISTISVGLNGAAAVFGAPPDLPGGGFFRLRFYQPTNSWYRVSASLPPPLSVEYLVVAGGGAGGWNIGNSFPGAGGGAGGLLAGSSSVAAFTAYTVTVGAGGTATTSSATSGSNSVFSVVTSIGGGAGARGSGGSAQNGSPGGSGGGATGTGGVAGTGTAGQGNSGGIYTGTVGANASPGGGGSGSAGVNQSVVGNNGNAGGNGTSSSITGTSAVYAAGGGGGGYGATGTGGPAGGTGAGAGGNGAVSTASAGGSATANTGSAGGGSGANTTSVSTSGGSGGSGVVIIAYPSSFANLSNISGTLVWTLDIASRPGFKVYRFTAGTGTIQW